MSASLMCIPAGAITEKDKEQFHRALVVEGDGRPIEDLLKAHEDNWCQIWRFEAENGYGIIVTEATINNELFVVYVAGSGMMEYIEDIVMALERWAKPLGITAITSRSNPGMARVLQRRCGFRALWTDMRKEL